MNPYHIVIVEDTAQDLTLLRKALKRQFPEIIIDAQVSGVPEAIETVRKYKPHFVILDVELDDDRLGFEVLEALPEMKFKALFTSAYNQYMRKAFLASATDYLEKPYSDEQLREAINNTIKKVEQENKTDVSQQLEKILKFVEAPLILNAKLRLVDIKGVHPVPISDIVFVEAQSNRTAFRLTNKNTIVVSSTLKDYEDLLERYNFIRVHRSFIVNMEHVEVYRKKGHDLIMRFYPDNELHITPEYRITFDERYGNFTIGDN